MLRGRFGRGFRLGALALATIVIAGALTSDPAEARKRRHHSKATKAAKVYAPPFSSLVVDANTGKVLQNTNGDALRHPASLTKIMTLYLLFEKLEAGQISLASPLRVSAHASRQAPSKLNLSSGDTINVENAIKAIVTKSANDVAVVIAENLAGDEPSFARRMTQKARALGMKNTTYLNASGLPNPDQWTTARDQVLLGRAIRDRFPRYYGYFSTRSFVFKGNTIRNHNRLLGRVEGVDGIKTGYIRASGFNLVTSLKRDGRYVVAAIFGGRSGRARDAQMATLVEKYTVLASTKRTTPMFAEQSIETPPMPPVPPTRVATAELTAKETPVSRTVGQRPASENAAPTRTDADAPEIGSKEPIKPVAVKTLAVRGSTMQTASLAPAVPSTTRIVTAQTVPSPDPRHQKPIDLRSNDHLAVAHAAAAGSVPPPPPGARPGVLGVLPVQVASADTAAPVAERPNPAARHDGWIIQVGALASEEKARERLAEVRAVAPKRLAGVEAYTETIKSGRQTLYRARFANFDEAGAKAACRTIKASKIACMPARN
jgi:D-alanyl-D-alanine carboxypeptidase